MVVHSTAEGTAEVKVTRTVYVLDIPTKHVPTRHCAGRECGLIYCTLCICCPQKTRLGRRKYEYVRILQHSFGKLVSSAALPLCIWLLRARLLVMLRLYVSDDCVFSSGGARKQACSAASLEMPPWQELCPPWPAVPTLSCIGANASRTIILLRR